MSDLEWWVFHGQRGFFIEPIDDEVCLIARCRRGDRWVGEYKTVEKAVKKARELSE